MKQPLLTAKNSKTVVYHATDEKTENEQQHHHETPKRNETSKINITDSVSFFELFRFSTISDKVLLFIGCLVAFISGGVFPALNVATGEILDLFIHKTRSEKQLNYCESLNFTNISSDLNSSSENDFLEEFSEKCEWLCLEILVLGCLKLIFGYIMIVCLDTMAENQAFCIRDKFVKAILRQDISWFDTNLLQDFSNKMTTELSSVQDGMGQKLAMFISLISTAIIGVGVAFVFDWRMTLVMLATTPFMIFSGAFTSKIYAKLTAGEMDAYGKAGAIAQEVISSIRTVVAFGGEQKEIVRYTSNLLTAKTSGIRRGLFAGIGQGIVWFIWYIMCALGFWYGSTRVFDSFCIESEGFTAKSLFVIFFNLLMGSVFIGQSAPHAAAVGVARVAAKKLFDVINRKSHIDSFSTSGEKPRTTFGKLKMKTVFFSYPSRPDVTVLRNLSLEALPGETIALVGSSGSGKSTIMQLLQRFYDPQDGQVLLDDRKLSALNVGWLRDNIGVVGQEPDLFDVTIAENIRYGRLTSSPEDIERAAKDANAHEFISKLPKKYDTLVGEKGAQLSGGQKQRIAIARALIKNPKILLLDEATSALDTENEAVVQKALDKAKIGRTTIIAAHRLSTIRQANKIFVLEKGQVKESGNHEELIAKRGLYYKFLTSNKMDAPNNESVMEEKVKHPFQIMVNRQTDLINSENAKVKNNKEETVKKGKNKPSKWRLLKMNLKEWPYIVMGLLMSIVLGVSFPLYGVLYGTVLSALSEGRKQGEKDINVLCIILIVFGIVALITVIIQYLMFAISGERLTLRIRTKLFTKIITQDMAWYDEPQNSTGALCSRLASDAASIQGATGSRLSTVMLAMSALLAAIAVSLFYNIKIALVVLAFIPFLLGSFYFKSRINSGQILDEKKAIEKASKVAVEAIMNIRTVSSLRLEDEFRQQQLDALKPSHVRAKKNAHISGFVYGLAQAIPWFAQATALYYGSVLIQTGELFYGDLFKAIEGVFSGTWVIGTLVSYAPDYDKGKVAAVRIFELLDRKTTIDVFSTSGKKPVKPIGNIEFSDVHFRYPIRPEAEVLKGVNLDISSGQTVALVGSSGCGKSTCIQLLERFYDARGGKVKIDGINVKELNVNWLRSQIGLVSQEPVLFSNSIADNIAYGDNSRSVPMNEIIDAAKKANIHSFIQSLPLGYDADIGSKGISGGQKQRVAIARALIRNPRILLLDEATSALDSESEKIVQETLDSAREGRTCITIGHRLSTIQNADRIFVMDKGQIVEQGTHQELLSLEGHYYKLFSTQELQNK